ncbi:nicotinate phosphoribosyltransferase [Neolewinella aurantiaca]|uniref:Nicotinate phosphoribosyltransferase n=1 Tax=Neolewinella aurantiaca TaxID=2602767 RepID=A0A5C7FF75_9BACT|nr:nicotinate phosphoribosyltransferase [Neolewinella aurantiaca]TXF88890.1 nicotinate phosphoribosyltransferase [Neolewinella aurantiaca]
MSATSHLSTVYKPDFGLLTDLYQLTMAAGYYDQKLHQKKAIFHLFYRKAPFGGDFAVSAGLALAIDLVKGLKFSADDVQYLGRLKGANGKPLFKEPFLNYLQRMKFSGNIYAVPEGEIVLPHEPLLRIEGNIIECQLLETALLTVMNFSTLIATKAARIKAAAGPDTVLEFGLRRAQGIDGGLTASRSAYIGGCDATSNVWAGRYYGVPVKGTHAHSWVMAFPSEEKAFEAYAAAMPNNVIFLVDTYDTLDGIAEAIREATKLRARGHEMLGVRLDSGDLAELSIAAREMLDAAGFPDAQVIASDSLDEYAIAELKAKGARIDVWGIGTRLATAHDQPALGGVYKLAAIEEEDGEWSPRIKLSETAIKVSNPGRQGVRRYYDEKDGFPMGSIIYNQFNGEPTGRFYTEEGFSISIPPGLKEDELLRPVFEDGELVYSLPSLQCTRDRALKNWKKWSLITNFANFPHGLDAALQEEKMNLLEDFGFDAL